MMFLFLPRLSMFYRNVDRGFDLIPSSRTNSLKNDFRAFQGYFVFSLEIGRRWRPPLNLWKLWKARLRLPFHELPQVSRGTPKRLWKLWTADGCAYPPTIPTAFSGLRYFFNGSDEGGTAARTNGRSRAKCGLFGGSVGDAKRCR